jgi:hypothetical protein
MAIVHHAKGKAGWYIACPSTVQDGMEGSLLIISSFAALLPIRVFYLPSHFS